MIAGAHRPGMRVAARAGAAGPQPAWRVRDMHATTPYPTSGPGPQIEAVLQPAEIRMLLIAGGDLRAMEETAVEVYRAGHIPILCEWFASPLVSISEQSTAMEPEFTELVHPIAERLLARCDSVLRV